MISLARGRTRSVRRALLASIVMLGAVGAAPAAAVDLSLQPRITYQGEAREWLGSAIANRPCDLDGDGYDDLLLASEKWQSNAGELAVVLGGPERAGGDVTDQANAEVIRLQGLGRFGGSVDCAGDVNGDGLDDLIVGAYQFGNGTGANGSAFVIFGAEDFKRQALAFQPSNPGSTGFRIDGNGVVGNRDDGLGYSVAGVGDIDGDGFDDVAVAAHLGKTDGLNNNGTGYVVKGKADTATVKLSDPSTWLLRVRGDQALRQMRGLAGVGDFDGDGVDDIAFGTNLHRPYGRVGYLPAEPPIPVMTVSAGTIWVVSGATRGDFSLAELDPTSPNYDAARGTRIVGAPGNNDPDAWDPGSQIGMQISGVGDVNGDGRPDLMSSAENAVVVFGRQGARVEIDLAGLGSCGCGYRMDGDGGAASGSPGDVDGDGRNDVAFGNKASANSDAVYFAFGRSAVTPLDLTTLTPAQGSRYKPAADSASGGPGSRFGTRLGVADFNGDGSPDIVVGASNANALGRTEAGEVTIILMPAKARAALTPATHDFGARAVGDGPSATRSFELANSGDLSLKIDAIELTGPAADQFVLEAGDCAGRELAGGRSCAVQVAFDPTSAGDKVATLTVLTAADDVTARLTATGLPAARPVAELAPAAIDFDEVRAGTASATRTARLTNSGNHPLEVGAVALRGTGSASYRLTTNCGGTLRPGAACVADVVFVPAANGSHAAELVFSTSDGERTTSLTGHGVTPAPPQELVTVPQEPAPVLPLPTASPAPAACAPAGLTTLKGAAGQRSGRTVKGVRISVAARAATAVRLSGTATVRDGAKTFRVRLTARRVRTGAGALRVDWALPRQVASKVRVGARIRASLTARVTPACAGAGDRVIKRNLTARVVRVSRSKA